jgi:pyridoxal phosphate enzyme (YggS family)
VEATPERFQDRLARIRERMAEACARAGRRIEDVLLLPVSKTVSPEAIGEAVAAGLLEFGENRVQEARQKIPQCPGSARWRLIGHLQSNKVHEAVRLFHRMDSLDSLRLLELVDRACREEGKSMPVCLEVNVAGEASKFGLAPEAVPAVLEAAQRLARVQVVGVMAIPPLREDPQESRPYFRQLRDWREAWQRQTGAALPELSMGMSNDFEVAIEEGSTCVRLGTALFGRRAPAARRAAVEECEP